MNSHVCAQERGVIMAETAKKNKSPTKTKKESKKKLLEKERLEVRNSIEESLKSQLLSSGNTEEYANDMVNDYLFFYDLKNKLQDDINKNGVRVKYKNGNGLSTEKDNASVSNLLKVNSQMLKILTDLNLKDPTYSPSNKGADPGGLLSRD